MELAVYLTLYICLHSCTMCQPALLPVHINLSLYPQHLLRIYYLEKHYVEQNMYVEKVALISS